MYADLTIHPQPQAARQGVSPMGYAFALLVVAMSMGAFYFLFSDGPNAATPGVMPSARNNAVYVLLWLIIYGAAAIVCLRDALRLGISLRLLVLMPFAVYVVLSSFWANNPSSSLIFASMLALDLVVAAALAAMVPPRVLLLLIAWTVVGLSAVSLVLIPFAPDIVIMQADRPGFLVSGSLAGVFSHKSAMGLYVSIALLVLMFVDRSRWLYKGPPMAILAVALLLTNAVAAIVAFVATVLVLSVANRAGHRSGLILGAAAVMAIALSVFLPYVDLGWVSEALQRGATLTGRTDIWSMGKSFIAERPLFGFGYHSFFDATPFSRVWALQATEEYYFAPHFHNSALDVMIGLGLVGLVAYLVTLTTANLVFLNRTIAPRVASVLTGTMIVMTFAASADFTFLSHNTCPSIVLFYVFLVAGRNYGGADDRGALSTTT